MASCKDCIHSECCFMQYGKTNALKWQSKLGCKNFKDRSRFVELPCERGDLVYFIKARRVMADIVSKFTIDKCGVMLQRVNGYNFGYTDQLGKKIFLTHEEAEQALNERGKDE